MKKIVQLLVLIFLFIGIGFCLKTQKLQKDSKGNYHAIKDSTISSKESISSTNTNTGHTYTDTKGNTYPVYQSVNGKLFVIKISKKTGNQYRYYLKV